jgi:hypothetical protein
MERQASVAAVRPVGLFTPDANDSADPLDPRTGKSLSFDRFRGRPPGPCRSRTIGVGVSRKNEGEGHDFDET